MNQIPSNIDIINSVLYVKASGAISDVTEDLLSEPTKSIAQLLNEKNQTDETNEKDQATD